MRIPLLCILGPTAGGKSALSMRVARDHPIEIVCLDSAQVYRGMDVGTAKPTLEERAAVPHHMLDLVDPSESYSAARYADEARAVIEAIHGRGRLPVLVGGTFLYLRALLGGLSRMPGANARIRERLEHEAARDGWPALHRRLASIDTAAADAIHPNDAQRIQRALEIIELTGQSRSELHAQPGQGWPGPVLKLAVAPATREELRERIAVRFAQMMEAGFLSEVQALYARGDLTPNLPSVRAVGYRQLWAYCAGDSSLDEAVARGITATRQYAKRQFTWLRGDADVHWCRGSADEIHAAAVTEIERFISESSAW